MFYQRDLCASLGMMSMVMMAMRVVTMDGCVGDGDDGDEGYYYCALSKRHGSEEHYTTMFII